MSKPVHLPRTATQRLADRLLGRPIEHFVAERREAGRSWRLVVRDLFAATGGEIDVTEATVRGWMDPVSSAPTARAVGQ